MKKLSHVMAIIGMLLFFSTFAGAQGGGVMFTGGVASFRMNDLKYLQEDILGTYPVEGRITSSFPPFTSLSLTTFKQYFDYLRVGLSYSYSTTGGKSSYMDYSGKVVTEMSATSHRLGAYLSYVILGGDRVDLALAGRVDANYSSVFIESYYNIYSFGNSLSNKYWSISPSGCIGPELFYNLNKISLGIEAGYLVDLQGKLKDSSDGNPLPDPNDRNRALSSDWTGWYARASVVIRFQE